MAQAQENLKEMKWSNLPEPKKPEDFQKWKPPVGPTELEVVDERIKTVRYTDASSGIEKSFDVLVLTVAEANGAGRDWEIGIREEFTEKSLIGQLRKIALENEASLVGAKLLVVGTLEKGKAGKEYMRYSVFRK